MSVILESADISVGSDCTGNLEGDIGMVFCFGREGSVFFYDAWCSGGIAIGRTKRDFRF